MLVGVVVSERGNIGPFEDEMVIWASVLTISIPRPNSCSFYPFPVIPVQSGPDVFILYRYTDYTPPTNMT